MNKPTVTFALSATQILESVYALAAMQRFSARISRDEMPEILSRDEAPALRRLLRAAAVNIVAGLLPHVTHTDLDDAETLTIVLSQPGGAELDGGTQSLLRLRLEEAIAAGVLELVYYSSCPGLSHDFQGSSVKALDDIRAIIDRPANLRLRPHWL